MAIREESTLDQALARTGDGAFVITSDGRIVLWNRAAEKILGHTAREAVGRPCCELLVGRDDGGNRLCYKGCHVMTLVKMGIRSRISTCRPVRRPGARFGSTSVSLSPPTVPEAR